MSDDDGQIPSSRIAANISQIEVPHDTIAMHVNPMDNPAKTRPRKMAKMATNLRISLSRKKRSAEIVKEMKWVIFPHQKWVKIWDMTALVLLLLLSFIIPYQVGVSGGYNLLRYMWWLVANVIINAFFFVDTFLYFWRAYRTDDGKLIFNLYKIRMKYLKTHFLINLLSCSPSVLIFYFASREYFLDAQNLDEIPEQDIPGQNLIIVIRLLNILKLGRFLRIGTIFSSSNVVTTVTDKFRTQSLELLKYIFLIIIVSHWFACTWSFVAFMEAGGYGDSLANTRNWISYWCREHATECGYNEECGLNQKCGLNPIGWRSDKDRYVLSLFWAIQTITSIGYGNIMPLTRAEWWIGSLLMLGAGVMWAYVIGGLVGVTAAMEARDDIYRARMDEANDLIDEFPQEYDTPDLPADTSKIAKRRIQTFIHAQQRLSQSNTSVSSIRQCFPVVESLSPELKKMACYLVMRENLEVVPYLSSRFLSLEEQSLVALNCVLLEFAAGEQFQMDSSISSYGRGIFILKRGCAFASRVPVSGQGMFVKNSNSFLLIVGRPVGDDSVLLEDGAPGTKGSLRFLTFSKVVFIPRQAVLDALAKNQKAWKDCARWRYLHACLYSFHKGTTKKE